MKLRSRTAFLVALFLLSGTTAGCTSVKSLYSGVFHTGNLITYEQYLSLDQDANPPPTVDEVIAKLGKPRAVHDRDGARRVIEYHAFSLTDELRVAEFHFDDKERLTKKQLW